MVEPPDIASLVQGIEAREQSVVNTLSGLSDLCVVDADNRTLFDVAIVAQFSEAISILVADEAAREFAAPPDADTRNPIRQSAAMYDLEYPIDKLESQLQKSFGAKLAFGRTPLQTACRAGNVEAMEVLIAAGAKTNHKDVLGLTAGELAVFAHGEAGLGNLVTAFEKRGLSTLPVSKRLLRETFRYPGTLERLVGVAKLDAYAMRLLFCYRCAQLDVTAVQAMLAAGHDPNKGLGADINPLWEACTSALLWDAEIPGGFEIAYHYTKHWGHPDASSVSFDNALLNEDGSNFGALFAEAQRKQREQTKIVDAMRIDPDDEAALIERRIELLNVLLPAGADLGLARKKLNLGSFADLREMKLGEVADRLKRRAGPPEPKVKQARPASSTFWELAGETGLNVEYWPDEGASGVIRLVLHNVYGPVDGLSLSVGLSNHASGSNDGWHDLLPVRECVDIDGELVARADLKEPIYGEAPWEAHYEFPIAGDNSGDTLLVRLHHDDDSLSGELDAWQFVKR
ncbi:MAG: hypothetical protein AAGI27_06460 [Pseudomonadota bacterium]